MSERSLTRVQILNNKKMNREITTRQQEIINASLELINETGIQSLTIKNLAAKVGFAESAVYRHYKNKVQILLAILNFFDNSTEFFFTSQLDADRNALDKIENLFMKHFNKFSSTPSLVAVIFAEEIFRNEIELSEKVTEIMSKNTSKLKIIIEHGQAADELRTDIEASHLATIVMGSLRLFVKQWQMSEFAFSLPEKGREFIKSIKNLLVKE